jgi:hypothetical protein
MTNARADQAPARSAIGLPSACTLVATLGLALVAAPGLARAAETADGASLPQDRHVLAPAPVMTGAPSLNSVAGTAAPSRWARVPLWQKMLGVGASLAGLAAVGSGAYLLWRDGQAACSPPSGTCAYHHQTALAGWLLVAGGTAASLGGVTLLLLPPIGESRGHAVARLAVSARF